VERVLVRGDLARRRDRHSSALGMNAQVVLRQRLGQEVFRGVSNRIVNVFV